MLYIAEISRGPNDTMSREEAALVAGMARGGKLRPEEWGRVVSKEFRTPQRMRRINSAMCVATLGWHTFCKPMVARTRLTECKWRAKTWITIYTRKKDKDGNLVLDDAGDAEMESTGKIIMPGQVVNIKKGALQLYFKGGVFFQLEEEGDHWITKENAIISLPDFEASFTGVVEAADEHSEMQTVLGAASTVLGSFDVALNGISIANGGVNIATELEKSSFARLRQDFSTPVEVKPGSVLRFTVGESRTCPLLNDQFDQTPANSSREHLAKHLARCCKWPFFWEYYAYNKYGQGGDNRYNNDDYRVVENWPWGEKTFGAKEDPNGKGSRNPHLLLNPQRWPIHYQEDPGTWDTEMIYWISWASLNYSVKLYLDYD